MLPISAHILLAKGHREDQSYHVSKEELKVFGDGRIIATAGNGKSESSGVRLSGSNPSSVTY